MGRNRRSHFQYLDQKLVRQTWLTVFDQTEQNHMALPPSLSCDKDLDIQCPTSYEDIALLLGMDSLFDYCYIIKRCFLT